MITTLGKLQIRSYIAGLSPAVGQALSIGTRNNAPALTDTRLGFEVARTPVTSTSLDPVTNKIVFKGTFDRADLIKVSEIGLWSSPDSEDSQLALSFDEFEESWEGDVTFTESAVSRIGSSLMNVSITNATAKTVTYYIESADFSSMLGPDDAWTLALNKTGAASLTVKVKMYSPNGATLEFNMFPSNTSATGYLFGEALGKNATVTGSFDPSNVDRFDVTVAPVAGNTVASTVQLDGLIATNAPSEREGSILVARALVNPVFVTTSVSPTDVEYELEVTL